MGSIRFIAWLVAGIAVTPVAIVLAADSAGAGHGHYVAAKVLFPYTMLSTHLFDTITPPFLLLGLVQFPLYGLVLAVASLKGKDWRVFSDLATVHTIAVLLCFVIPMPSFS